MVWSMRSSACCARLARCSRRRVWRCRSLRSSMAVAGDAGGCGDDAFPCWAEASLAAFGVQAEFLDGLVDRFGRAWVVGEHAHRVGRQAGGCGEHRGGLAQLRGVRLEARLGERADLRQVALLVARQREYLVEHDLPSWLEVAVLAAEHVLGDAEEVAWRDRVEFGLHFAAQEGAHGAVCQAHDSSTGSRPCHAVRAYTLHCQSRIVHPMSLPGSMR